jgi:hypothetical protein
MNFKVKYVIKPNHVNKSYDVFEKDWRGGLTFHSHRDTYEEAQEVVDDLNTKPSKIETLKFLKDLTSNLKQK